MIRIPRLDDDPDAEAEERARLAKERAAQARAQIRPTIDTKPSIGRPQPKDTRP